MANIAIIDDDVELSGNLAEILQMEGHEVRMLNQTEGAVEFILEDIPDLLLLDVMFPENAQGGFDLARELRRKEALRNLPIALLTGINQEKPVGFSDADIDDAWMPVQGFIEKPIDRQRLLQKVRTLLKHSES